MGKKTAKLKELNSIATDVIVGDLVIGYLWLITIKAGLLKAADINVKPLFYAIKINSYNGTNPQP